MCDLGGVGGARGGVFPIELYEQNVWDNVSTAVEFEIEQSPKSKYVVGAVFT